MVLTNSQLVKLQEGYDNCSNIVRRSIKQTSIIDLWHIISHTMHQNKSVNQLFTVP